MKRGRAAAARPPATRFQIGARYDLWCVDGSFFFNVEYRGLRVDGQHIFHGGVDFYLRDNEIVFIRERA